ncbi:dibenzothiophene desulfurization enzyme [Leifsonia xyli subsp. xyli]|uniref:Dibenzothiophene desulfurization enzyme A n=2 Tax=Leifsonia xyli subsp. xyli TaxID=59736 RepID=Q6ADN0_LEIXX|nr:NtaA/DmoA family FMN-dependent monooxygenase [Leifsonia xyli]AAT89516.1 dibenzothiophene desulfurization enzyme A [Leifsonia xyli subsp. xyli str. CTCB07]ODA91370.1 dibenzothiophene desulfurization enzyme [Leifsonia xyli subsp. xyli]
MHFGWFLGAGFGVQGWGDPTYGIGYDWRQPTVYQEAARAFEGAGFDLFIVEDGVAVPDTYGGTAEVNLAAARFVPKHDPLPLVPSLLSATSRLGVVLTLSASFTDPFTAARLLSTLQHFAGGRLGFNVVTSGSDLAAQNYGLDKQVEPDLRYDRAYEWVEVVRKLWRSWEPDAIVEDAATGVYADFRKVHPIHHEGRFFTVRGPLNTAPAAEEPVMVQAGASGRGRDFAGKNSDVVLALASTPERMREHRDSIRRVATENGRDADAITVLFVVQPILTANAEETASVRAARSELTKAAIDEQLQSISYLTGVDFKRFDLDAPLPEITTNSNRGTLDNFLSSAPAGSTLREILRKRANEDGLALIGTADEVADHLGELGEAVGGDGFLFTGQVHPANVHRTLDPLVPALRRRGLLRTELGDGGLRQNLADF